MNNHEFKKNLKGIDLRLFLSMKRKEKQLKRIEYQLRANKGIAQHQFRDRISFQFNRKKYNLKSSETRMRRKSFCLNEEPGYDDSKIFDNFNDHQSDIKQHPARIRRRSLSVSTDQYNQRDSSCNFKQNGEDNTEQNLKIQEDTNHLETTSNLLDVKENFDVTYIVPDSDVYLRNIDLLKDILHTDKQCCILVPPMVMNEIHTATKSHRRALAYRALYFIWQQNEENIAVIEESTEENYKIDNNHHRHDLLIFCSQITDQDIHVVLITDDLELINMNDTNICVITTAKMKQLVDEYKSNETSVTKIVDTEELANVKITFENESNDQDKFKINKLPVNKCMNPEKIFDEKNDDNPTAYNEVFQNDINSVSYFPKSMLSQRIADVRNQTIVPNKINYSLSSKTLRTLSKHLSHDLAKPKITDSKNIVLQRHQVLPTLVLDDSKSKAGNVLNIAKSPLAHDENLIWDPFPNVSAELSYKRINEGSDSSSIIYRNVNRRENVTIEETSNSVISNTTTTVDTESDRGGVQKMNVGIDSSVVMFEVTDSRMEEVLRVKSDEWVSRFVQIMEEALSQLLQHEPSFVQECMPPPWTLHEAAECAKKHFCYDSDVVDAADRLLTVSRDHGGLRGKIKSNISPHKYMELYSYGVYLIDALQGVVSHSEDLQTAAEGLSNLLNDIQQSNVDPSNRDSFTDISAHDIEANISTDKDKSNPQVTPSTRKKKTVKERRNKKKQSTTSTPMSPRGNKKIISPVTTPSPRKEIINQSPPFTPSTPGKYNLRSQSKNSTKVNCITCNDVTYTFDPQSNFFSSLYLKKNTTSNSEMEQSQLMIGTKSSDNKQAKSSSPSPAKTIIEPMYSSGESTAPILKGDPKMYQPKVVRNFKKCAEFEKKIKLKTSFLSDNNQESWTYEDEDNGIFNEEFTDYTSNVYNFDSEFYINEDLWYNARIPDETDLNSNLQFSNPIDSTSENETATFKSYMENLENNIVKAYTKIQKFCVTSYGRLQSEALSVNDTSRMVVRAEEMLNNISRICDLFEGVVKRENSPCSIFQIWKTSDLTDVIIEDDDKEIYRVLIGNCLDQGKLLKESIELVILTCKLRPKISNIENSIAVS